MCQEAYFVKTPAETSRDARQSPVAASEESSGGEPPRSRSGRRGSVGALWKFENNESPGSIGASAFYPLPLDSFVVGGH